jgi:hypothetical protein
MAEVIPRWKMQCHNTEPRFGEHQIEIPSPKHLELRPDQLRLERDNLETVFACSQCGHVYSYMGSETRCWPVVLASGQHKPPHVNPLCIVLPCAGKGCGAQTYIRTGTSGSETTEQAIDRLRHGDFRVKCARGHPVIWNEDFGIFDTWDARPF